MTPLENIETWVFDLDNTLYPPSARLFDQINTQMTGFIMRELALGRDQATRLRRDYWRRYGATLHGLVRNHAIDPHAFLAEAHAIDYSNLRPDAALTGAINALPGRKIVHTNGARSHARAVLRACGLADAFDAVYALEDKSLIPKPDPRAYERIRDLSDLRPARAAMIEDSAENLTVPKQMGMATVWLCHEAGVKAPAHVDRRITCLTGFLTTQA